MADGINDAAHYDAAHRTGIKEKGLSNDPRTGRFIKEEKGWVFLSVSPLDPDDTTISLHRHYKGTIRAIRSDGLEAIVSWTTSHRGDPAMTVMDFRSALQKLEIYRTCSCSKTVPCDTHRDERMSRAMKEG